MKALIRVLRFILTHPLSKKNKTKALIRFFSYQVNKVFNPFPIIYTFTEKTKLIIEKGMLGATGNLYCGLHEFEDMSFLLHFLKPADLFVDVGANIGSYTVLASGQIGCKTFAFEPVPSTCERLRNNVSINHIEERVSVQNIAVGAKKDILTFTSGLDTINHVALEKENVSSISVQSDSLDHVMQDRCPALIKIDVEGYESEVIHGASAMLNNLELKAIIIELNGSGEKYGYVDESIHQTLLGFQFLPYRYIPFKRELVRIDSFGEKNTLYLRDIGKVKERIKTAVPISILGSIY